MISNQTILPFHYVILPHNSSVGERLDVFLSKQLGRSRTHVQSLISDQAVTLQPPRSHLTANTRLRVGDTVMVKTLAEKAPSLDELPLGEEIPLTVIFEDEYLLALNKPPGLVVHPAAGHATGTLVNALVHHCRESLARRGGENRLGIVHRLDKDTSGVILVAKTDPVHEKLSQAFAERTVKKFYQALCWGVFRVSTGTCRGAIGRHPVHRKKMSVLASGGRSAQTDYKILTQGTAGAEVECRLHTGRTHQIRVHLSALGHPIWGDSLYGRVHQRQGYTPGRQMLHAARLALLHPVTGKELLFEADVPPDYLEAKQKLLA